MLSLASCSRWNVVPSLSTDTRPRDSNDGSNSNGDDYYHYISYISYILPSLDVAAREIDAIFASRPREHRRNHRREIFTSWNFPLPPPPIFSRLRSTALWSEFNFLSPGAGRKREKEYLSHRNNRAHRCKLHFSRRTSADARLTAAAKRIIYGLSLCLTLARETLVLYLFALPLLFFPPSTKLTRAENNADTV